MTNAILAYASYLPSWRVDPAGRGTARRIVASFDEDAITMSVAAARSLRAAESARSRVLATSSPAYLDKTNATTVHAALGLDRRIPASDAIGTARSTLAAVRAAVAGQGALIVAADVRTGRPGSADERTGTDAAAAVLIGAATPEQPAIAEVLATVSLTEEFLDRWRSPAEPSASSWEERFGYEQYAPLVREAATAALDAAGVAQADHVVLTGSNSAITKRASTLVKGVLSTGGSPVGFAGAVDPLLGLAAVLDEAGPAETILLISAADGVDATVLRTTTALSAHRQPEPVAAAAAADGRMVPYPTYLSWRGLLDMEPPRRPEPDRPAGPPSARAAGWKFALTGNRCSACGFLHVPPMRVCRACGVADQSEPVSVRDRGGRIATFTVDRLAYSPSPPVVDVVVDFDGGGRATFEVADAAPEALGVGGEVTMVFRRLFTAGGVHNYFWKARQVPAAADTSGEEN